MGKEKPVLLRNAALSVKSEIPESNEKWKKPLINHLTLCAIGSKRNFLNWLGGAASSRAGTSRSEKEPRPFGEGAEDFS